MPVPRSVPIARLDYRTPPRIREKPPGCGGGCLGALICGVILPLCFAIYATYILHDMGGMLFWPMLMTVGGAFGAGIGIAISHIAWWLRDRKRRG